MNDKLFEPDGAARASMCVSLVCKEIGLSREAATTLVLEMVKEMALEDLYTSGSGAGMDEGAHEAYLEDYFAKFDKCFEELTVPPSDTKH
jgi:hypothetical protein